jgi:hypothetical protein
MENFAAVICASGAFDDLVAHLTIFNDRARPKSFAPVQLSGDESFCSRSESEIPAVAQANH